MFLFFCVGFLLLCLRSPDSSSPRFHSPFSSIIVLGLFLYFFQFLLIRLGSCLRCALLAVLLPFSRPLLPFFSSFPPILFLSLHSYLQRRTRMLTNRVFSPSRPVELPETAMTRPHVSCLTLHETRNTLLPTMQHATATPVTNDLPCTPSIFFFRSGGWISAFTFHVSCFTFLFISHF